MKISLKELISFLEKYPKNFELKNGFGSPLSYRGYYCELAFEPNDPDKRCKIGEMLDYAKCAVDCWFTGYKGGTFKMTLETPVNIAHYGICDVDVLGKYDPHAITPDTLKCWEQELGNTTLQEINGLTKYKRPSLKFFVKKHFFAQGYIGQYATKATMLKNLLSCGFEVDEKRLDSILSRMISQNIIEESDMIIVEHQEWDGIREDIEVLQRNPCGPSNYVVWDYPHNKAKYVTNKEIEENADVYYSMEDKW